MRAQFSHKSPVSTNFTTRAVVADVTTLPTTQPLSVSPFEPKVPSCCVGVNVFAIVMVHERYGPPEDALCQSSGI